MSVRTAEPVSRASRRRPLWPRLAATLTKHTVLIVVSLVFLLPLVWMVSGSLKTAADIGKFPIEWFPEVITTGNYAYGLSAFPFARYFFNTLLICIPSMIGAAFSSALVGYGLARIDWPFRNALFGVLVATMMIPFYVTMVPLFTAYRAIGWTDTYLPLIVPQFFGVPFCIFLMRQFFMGIPTTLSDAARVDGAGELRIFFQVILPLCKPALAAVALFQFLASWSDLLGPLLYLSDSNSYTLSLGLTFFQGAEGDTAVGPLMAVSTLVLIPVIVLFFFAQRTFIQGITMTGIKG
ncbi:carbohydrate ABC transporter membrane protein 2, CUT1 family (TC 3.A.1.1.-) [Promicromonospora umidemergens]|uniref:Carbohydrate ABC transporter permease n=1 Tax=Promicromonospora umidemergens TaxID=629679 RepID=A0ABP8XLG0_9MICO|nr:carbohydrate ABC transporter permease [Promicromonospora umidemergens]MCP2282217.1 carbohydrate ABC transporter membrane protein 2, CUT1 family (TC 3.A.1.1.-) [Promicromonospora umidemergens]